MPALLAPDQRAVSYSTQELDLLDPTKRPSHIAIIMDGNRRWAAREGLPSIAGHWQGAETLTTIVRAAADLNVKTLTVYAFSTENWKRSKEEVDALMHLFQVYLEGQREFMREEGVRLQTIGDETALPSFVRNQINISKAYTAECKKIDLVLAMNYGGRDDIRRAFLAMIDKIQEGTLLKEDISELTISQHLDTAQWPDPDLLIRTSGESRQSNFLLWQLCYSEFYSTEVLWPDFSPSHLLNAVKHYQTRQRRWGGK